MTLEVTMNMSRSVLSATEVMDRLGISEDGNYSDDRCYAYPPGTCPDYSEHPTLMLFASGRAIVESFCVFCSGLVPPPLHLIRLPGFRSGRDLAEWLVSHGVDQLLLLWEDLADADRAAVEALVDRLVAAARLSVESRRSALFWCPSADEIVRLAWSPGDPPLTEDVVARVVDLHAWRNNLDLVRPREWTSWTEDANDYLDRYLEGVRLDMAVQVAGDPYTPQEYLWSLMKRGNARIAQAILQNSTASDDLRSSAAQCLARIEEEAPF